MTLDILNIEGKKTGRTVELPEEVFGLEPNDHVLYLAVKQYLAAQRQGSHKVKTRAEVKGASRKLHKQKGTGGSRKGNIRNPLYKGGGTIFGPKPRNYAFKLNKKVKDLAKISALSVKAKENSILIIEDVNFDAPKTKQFLNILNSLNINANSKKTLFILPEVNDNVYLSLRNIPTVNSSVLQDINTYDLLNSNYLVFTESAVKFLTETEEAPAEA
ncbi:50S ribosomal protein L4 [Chitinophaga caeni]|uniref:Large ribosomal subunit protein uL4 n=1 Tax=Chitinophaga caeni TaxID=2029983 RepID=A0A291QTY3_9BACT|nr:50S ribosomal protein L4 [Chitinophaga caeni]ATL47428.1 50S ribosomal protein L4 [Chitinophaga caeni]